MPADEIVTPPSGTGRGLINFWSRHHRGAIADQQKLQQMKRDFDPNPKAISGPSGQDVVYVNISTPIRTERLKGVKHCSVSSKRLQHNQQAAMSLFLSVCGNLT